MAGRLGMFCKFGLAAPLLLGVGGVAQSHAEAAEAAEAAHAASWAADCKRTAAPLDADLAMARDGCLQERNAASY